MGYTARVKQIPLPCIFFLYIMKRTIFITLLISSFTLSAKGITWDDVKQHLKISGYLQTYYHLELADATTATSSFRVRRARVSFAGDIVKSDKYGYMDYRLQVDFASSPQIVDAWLRYRPFRELGVQVGQFKVPLSIENSEYAPLQLEFIDYSLVVQRLVRMSGQDVAGINSTGRDCGVQLYGGFIEKGGLDVLNYNLAVFNGNGINRGDNNRSKDVVARVMVSPLRDLTIAAYYQYGEGDFGEKRYVCYQRYGGGVAYEGSHAFTRAEYIAGVTGSLSSDGAYASAGWKFSTSNAGNGFVGARFDYFDEDIHTSQREFNYTLGAAYNPWRYLRLQFNYVIKQYHNHHKPLSHNLMVMVSGIF